MVWYSKPLLSHANPTCAVHVLLLHCTISKSPFGNLKLLISVAKNGTLCETLHECLKESKWLLNHLKYFHAFVASAVIVNVNTCFSSNPNVFKDASSRTHYYGLSPLQTLTHSPETVCNNWSWLHYVKSFDRVVANISHELCCWYAGNAQNESVWSDNFLHHV